MVADATPGYCRSDKERATSSCSDALLPSGEPACGESLCKRMPEESEILPTPFLPLLPQPAWEIYAALCQPLPPGPLPSLSELKRLYSDAAAAAPAQRTISDAATAALVPAQHTRAAAAAIAAEKGDTGRDMTSCSRGAMATGGIDELEHAIKSSVGDAKFEALQRRVAAFEAAMDRQLKLRHNKHRDPVAIGGAKFDSGTAQASRLAAALWSVYSTAPKIQL